MTDERDDLPLNENLPDVPRPAAAVNLWPLAVIAMIAACALLAYLWMPEYTKHADEAIPTGKSYTATGALLTCEPFTTPHGYNISGNSLYRVLVRTPDDLFFDVFFRGYHQPPAAGMAIGVLKYYECGKVDGVRVHCFDTFQVTHEGLPALDNNGKRVPVAPTPAPTAPKPKP